MNNEGDLESSASNLHYSLQLLLSRHTCQTDFKVLSKAAQAKTDWEW